MSQPVYPPPIHQRRSEPSLLDANPTPDNELEARLRAYLKRTLSPPRFSHCERVQKQAQELATCYGVNIAHCSLAGLAHDLGRELPEKKLITIARTFRRTHFSIYRERKWQTEGEFLTNWEKSSPVLLHGVASAVILEEQFSLQNPLILEAVEHHTLGFLGMSDVTKIIYVADFIEPGRKFDNSTFRQMVGKISLDELAKRIVANSYKHDLEVGRNTFPPVLEMIYEQESR